MRLRDRITVLAHPVRHLKSVDWIGRWEDIKTAVGLVKIAISAVVATITGGGVWLMANWKIALTIALAAFVLFMLFLPAIAQEMDERRFWQRYMARKHARARRAPPALRRLARKAERLAADLERERLNPELGTLPHQNRRTLREVCRQLAEHGIQHPPPNPRPGETLEWEHFIGNLVSFVEDGRANELPTLYEHLRVAYARRDTQRDVATILRRFQETDDAPNTEG